MENEWDKAAQMPIVQKERNLAEVKRIYRNMDRRIDRCRIKATLGDNDSARKMLELCVELYGKLREFGYRKTTELENPANKLVPITQEWLHNERAMKTKLERLQEKARRTNKKEDIATLIRAIARGMQ